MRETFESKIARLHRENESLRRRNIQLYNRLRNLENQIRNGHASVVEGNLSPQVLVGNLFRCVPKNARPTQDEIRKKNARRV